MNNQCVLSVYIYFMFSQSTLAAPYRTRKKNILFQINESFEKAEEQAEEKNRKKKKGHD